MQRIHRLAICDDSPQDRHTMHGLVQRYLDSKGDLAKVDLYESCAVLLDSREKYDLVLLDIVMNGTSTIEAAGMLAKQETAIILMSSTNSYAAESYDVNALHYLVKPVSSEKLFTALDKFFLNAGKKEQLYFRQDRMDDAIPVSDVLWIEAGDHKSVIHTRYGDIQTSTLFSSLCMQLGRDNKGFVRPIRWAMVALREIAAITAAELTLCDGTRIPISRSMRQEVKRVYMDYAMDALVKKGKLL